MSKATESYEKLEMYISNGTFTFDISNSPTLPGFEKVIGEKMILVAKCVPNTEEYFPRKYTKSGKLSKMIREYFNPDDENFLKRTLGSGSFNTLELFNAISFNTFFTSPQSLF